ncbi:hypothetical protein TeGR_g1020, partial [Tetraparma gracilis]
MQGVRSKLVKIASRSLLSLPAATITVRSARGVERALPSELRFGLAGLRFGGSRSAVGLAAGPVPVEAEEAAQSGSDYSAYFALAMDTLSIALNNTPIIGPQNLHISSSLYYKYELRPRPNAPNHLVNLSLRLAPTLELDLDDAVRCGLALLGAAHSVAGTEWKDHSAAASVAQRPPSPALPPPASPLPPQPPPLSHAFNVAVAIPKLHITLLPPPPAPSSSSAPLPPLIFTLSNLTGELFYNETMQVTLASLGLYAGRSHLTVSTRRRLAAKSPLGGVVWLVAPPPLGGEHPAFEEQALEYTQRKQDASPAFDYECFVAKVWTSVHVESLASSLGMLSAATAVPPPPPGALSRVFEFDVRVGMVRARISSASLKVIDDKNFAVLSARLSELILVNTPASPCSPPSSPPSSASPASPASLCPAFPHSAHDTMDFAALGTTWQVQALGAALYLGEIFEVAKADNIVVFVRGGQVELEARSFHFEWNEEVDLARPAGMLLGLVGKSGAGGASPPPSAPPPASLLLNINSVTMLVVDGSELPLLDAAVQRLCIKLHRKSSAYSSVALQ